MNYIYQNYHKHSERTNPIISDSTVTYKDYAEAAVKYGHSILSSAEHGYQGRYIETYDTAFIQVETTGGAVLKFCATHACGTNVQPRIRCEFEKSTIYIEECGDDNAIKAVMKDGREISYGATSQHRSNKLWMALDIVRGNAKPVCTVDTAMSHLKCIDAISEFYKPSVFEKYEIINDCKAVAGLEEMLEKTYQTGEMPSLYNPDKLIDMTKYTQFGGIKE